MKLSVFFQASLLMLGGFVSVFAGPAAPTNATTEATTALLRSEFKAPKTPQEGRDPFFPNSMRVYGLGTVPVAKTNVVKAAAPPQLVLKALAGTGERRFATINNRVFGAGEEGEVNAAGSRVKLRCLEIHEDMVLVEAGGVRQQLRMRPGF